MSESATTEGKYMYCIIRSAEPRQFSQLGIGERGDIVHVVCHDGLAAVVSNSPTVEYENTRRNMMAHTLVLEEVMKGSTILPIRFGTIGPSEEAVRERVLKRRYAELMGLLNEMDGRVELGLKAFWYEGIVFEEILSENPDIVEWRDRLVGRPSEETYYDRIRLGEMISTAMNAKRVEDAEHILSRLRPLVHQTRKNKEITDRMVLNAAFLLDTARQESFDKAVQELDAEMGSRLVFKYVGPVPPYNFVNLVVSWDEE